MLVNRNMTDKAQRVDAIQVPNKGTPRAPKPRKSRREAIRMATTIIKIVEGYTATRGMRLAAGTVLANGFVYKRVEFRSRQSYFFCGTFPAVGGFRNLRAT